MDSESPAIPAAIADTMPSDTPQSDGSVAAAATVCELALCGSVAPTPAAAMSAAVMLGAGILLLILTGWVGFRTFQAYQHLTAARDVVSRMQDEFDRKGISEPDVLIGLAVELRDQAAAAGSAVDDPIYRLATGVPWVGDNLDAVGQLARAVDVVAAQVPAGAELTRSLDAAHLLPHGGAIDLRPRPSRQPGDDQHGPCDPDRGRPGGFDRSGPSGGTGGQSRGRVRHKNSRRGEAHRERRRAGPAGSAHAGIGRATHLSVGLPELGRTARDRGHFRLVRGAHRRSRNAEPFGTGLGEPRHRQVRAAVGHRRCRDPLPLHAIWWRPTRST